MPAADSTDGRRPPDNGPGPIELDSRNPLRRLAAELLGTFLLTLVAAGGEMMAVTAPAEVSSASEAIAPGLIVLAMVYAVSDVSGAHFNPAVTFGFALRGDFRWRFVPLYWLAQALGAAAAAGALRTLLGNVAHLGVTSPKASEPVALAIETVLTATLVTVILGTATRAGVLGPHAAIPVGATIALAGMIFGPISGASMNPARSFGPAIVSGHRMDLWLYLLGPALGAVAAVLITSVIHGPREREERAAAEGDQAK